MSSPRKTKGKVNQIDLEIAEKLKKLRSLKNISQQDLAERLDVSFQQVQKYEKGVNRISAGKLIEICSIFGVSPNYFSNFDLSEEHEVLHSISSEEIIALIRECEGLSKQQLDGVIRFLKGIKN